MDKTETKMVYSYDSTGLLIGAHTLDYTDRSHVSGRWQIPSNMTETDPPAAKTGYTINWTGAAWEYVEIPKVVEPETPKVVETTNKMPTFDERLTALELVANAQLGV